MKLLRLVPVAILVVAVAMFWGLQADAYNVFTAVDGNCSQCHTDWPGATHSVHSGAFACSTCHDGSPGDNPVLTTVCTACHDVDGLFQLHGGTEAPSGEYCGDCHPGVGAEHHTWTELKNIFD